MSDRIEGGEAAVAAARGNRRGWVQDLVPFASSLALHAGVVALGLLTAQAYRIATTPPLAEHQTGMPTMDIDSPTTPDGVKFQSLNNDPFRRIEQDLTEHAADGVAEAMTSNVRPAMASLGGGSGESTDALIGLGADAKFGRGKDGHGNGRGNLRGNGSEGGGPPAPWGVPGGGGQGFLKGPPEKARSVAFVCDASGSMIHTFGSLKVELTKAVSALTPVQGFNIIFFQGDRANGLNDGLLVATPENKRKAFNFLDEANTSGTTNPIPGIELAFRSKPHLVYLLTDADFPDNAAVLGAIRRLNATKQTRVNTIAFVSGGADEQVSAEFVELMRTIAMENGGTFRIVKETDLD